MDNSELTHEEYIQACQRLEEIIKLNVVNNDTPEDDPLFIELAQVSDIIETYEKQHFSEEEFRYMVEEHIKDEAEWLEELNQELKENPVQFVDGFSAEQIRKLSNHRLFKLKTHSPNEHPNFEYKGFKGSVEFDEGIIYGKIIEIPDLVTFESSNIDEAEKAFNEAVEDYILLCKEVGKEPPMS